ncbi:DKNYY domain-containing protein [Aquimarina sp. 2201CG1-2-11]|uniref:DKNYY domain-containing protein n=1 Tax=Aquimarina discodermiae TaxID=3231043 RepID=UPI003462B09E
MTKKVLMILITVFIVLAVIVVLGIYGIYRFLSSNRLGELINEEKSSSYYYNPKEKKTIYSPMGNWFELGKTEMNVDHATFQVLAENYAKDQNHVYHKYTTIDFDVDIPSFEIKYDFVPMDKNHVYVMNGFYFSENSKEGLTILEDADPNSYIQLNYHCAKDQNHVYFYNKKVPDIEVATFEILNDNFMKDTHFVCYFNEEKIMHKINATAKNTQSLPHDYIRDDKNIFAYRYYVGNNLTDIVDSIITIPFKDATTIVVHSEKYLSTDNIVYFDALAIDGIDATTFEFINGDWAKDKNNIIASGEIMEGGDVETFTFDENLFRYKDKNFIYDYDNGKLIKKPRKK